MLENVYVIRSDVARVEGDGRTYNCHQLQLIRGGDVIRFAPLSALIIIDLRGIVSGPSEPHYCVSSASVARPRGLYLKWRSSTTSIWRQYP